MACVHVLELGGGGGGGCVSHWCHDHCNERGTYTYLSDPSASPCAAQHRIQAQLPLLLAHHVLQRARLQVACSLKLMTGCVSLQFKMSRTQRSQPDLKLVMTAGPGR